MSDTIVAPETDELREEAIALMRTAETYVVCDDRSLEIATGYRRTAKTLEKKAKEYYRDVVAQAHRLHKTLVSKREELASIPANVEHLLQQKCNNYRAKVALQRRQEEERQREHARKEAEERRIVEAQAAEASGDKEAADALLAAPIPEPVVTPSTPPPPKMKGVAVVKTWRANVVDPQAVIRSTGAKSDTRAYQFLSLDHKAIQAFAKSTKGQLSIPGIEFLEVVSDRIRTE